MKAQFFKSSDLISIIWFTDTLKLACNTKNIHESAASQFLRFFVKNALETTINGCMSPSAYITPYVASLITTEPLT